MSEISFQDVVEYFGNQQKTADALKITQPSVNHILATGNVSVEVALRIQKVTKNTFSALDLRPSLKRDFSEICVS